MKEHIGSKFGSQSTTEMKNLCTLHVQLREVSGHPSSTSLVCLGRYLVDEMRSESHKMKPLQSGDGE